MAARPPTLPALTGLRFLAALPVVLFHLLPRSAMSPGWAHLADQGYVTVGLFFVLSGFVLTYAHASDDTVRPGPFYRARFARIYPVYALAMLLALPAYAAFYPSLRLPAWEFPVDLGIRFTLLQAWHPSWVRHYNVPSWSLSVEAFFYALFPLLRPTVMKLSRTEIPRSLIMVGVLAAFAPAFFEWMYPGTGPASDGYRALMIKFHPLIRLPEFLVGMLLGRLFTVSEGRLSARVADGFVLLSLSLLALAIGFRMPYVLLHTGGLTLPFALLIWALASGQGWTARLLSSRPMQALGNASYALYILHVPIMGVVIGRGYPIATLGFGVGLTLVCIALSLVVYRLLEVPMRGWLRGPIRACSPPAPPSAQ